MSLEKLSILLVLVSSLFMPSCKKQPHNPTGSSNANVKLEAELNAAIHELGTTLRNAPQLPTSATSGETVSDFNAISKSASDLTDAQLMVLFQSPNFATFKQDLREASAGTDSTTETNTSTDTQTNDNWFSGGIFNNTNASGSTQDTTLGIAAYFAIAAWNVIAAKLVLTEALAAWPERKMFMSVSFMRVAVGMGLSAGFLSLIWGGTSGEWNHQTFEDVTGALFIIDGVSASIWSLTALYTQYLDVRKSGEGSVLMHSHLDHLFDPSKGAEKTGVAELQMKWKYYQFLQTDTGNMKPTFTYTSPTLLRSGLVAYYNEQIAILKKDPKSGCQNILKPCTQILMFKDQKSVVQDTSDKNLSEAYDFVANQVKADTPERANLIISAMDATKVNQLNLRVNNPYITKLWFAVIPNIGKSVSNANVESDLTQKDTANVPKSNWKNTLDNQVFFGSGMKLVLGLGILKTIAGAYILATNNSPTGTNSSKGLALAQNLDAIPNVQYFNTLMSELNTLFYIHDRMYP